MFTIKAILYQQARCIHLTASSTAPALHKVFKKVLHPSKKKKFYVQDEAMVTHYNPFEKDTSNPGSKIVKRRVTVLNKLFMRHITDLMATGDRALEFAGHGLEINRIEVAPNYKGVNVFWIAKNSSDEVVEKLLEKESKSLRHELSQLRLMGEVPRVYFVKDKHFANMMDVDARLAEADFGEDYEPTELTSKLKTELKLNMQLESNIRQKIHELEKVLPLEIDDEIPEMPQNIFGLDHSYILNKIKVLMEKSQAKHRNENDETTNVALSSLQNENPFEFKTNKEQREAFRKFLLDRAIMQKKIRKMRRNEEREMEVYREDDDEEYVEELIETKFDDHVDEDIK